MRSLFRTDCPRGDRLAEFVYYTVFLGDDGLALSENAVQLVDYEVDPESQYAGVDIIVTKHNKPVYVEVKSAVDSAGINHSTGKPLATFAQEISFINDAGQIVDGWFINPRKKTGVYVFCWIPEIDKEGKARRGRYYYRVSGAEDAQVIEIAMVTTKCIKKMIYDAIGTQIGCDSPENLNERLYEIACKMREDSAHATLKLEGGYKFVMSNYLAEKPINLLVPKESIRKVSFHTYQVRKVNAKPEVHWAVVPW